MKRHMRKKERKQMGETHARKNPKQKFLTEGSKGYEFLVEQTKTKKKGNKCLR